VVWRCPIWRLVIQFHCVTNSISRPNVNKALWYKDYSSAIRFGHLGTLGPLRASKDTPNAILVLQSQGFIKFKDRQTGRSQFLLQPQLVFRKTLVYWSIEMKVRTYNTLLFKDTGIILFYVETKIINLNASESFLKGRNISKGPWPALYSGLTWSYSPH
jgi:hypothetical protein